MPQRTYTGTSADQIATLDFDPREARSAGVADDDLTSISRPQASSEPEETKNPTELAYERRLEGDTLVDLDDTIDESEDELLGAEGEEDGEDDEGDDDEDEDEDEENEDDD